jgi:hypothetical protein
MAINRKMYGYMPVDGSKRGFGVVFIEVVVVLVGVGGPVGYYIVGVIEKGPREEEAN